MKCRLSIATSAVLLVVIGGCSGTEDSTRGGEPGAATSHASLRGALCVLSADCSSGSHCDLGECVQSCSDDAPCVEGKTCSARGRCLDEGEEETEPPPARENEGIIQVDQQRVQLDETDNEFSIKLTATGERKVRYRVSVQAPYVSIDEKRGEFVHETTLSFKVDPSKVEGREANGAIEIFTDLGERVVEVPIQNGVSGRYMGALRYDSEYVALGDARIALDLVERQGDVDVLFDPETSLLFPETSYGKTTGFGTYTKEDGMEFTVLQRIDQSLGGSRNHFGRDLGRRLRVSLKRNGHGGLEGTFKEKVYGLFEQPVELQGTIVLSYRGGEKLPDFALAADAAMPTQPTVVAKDEPCHPVLAAIGGEGWAAALDATLTTAQSYYGLDESMKNRVAKKRSYADLVSLCGEEMEGAKPEPKDVECAWLPALLCAGTQAAGVEQASRPQAFNRLMPSALSGPLLVAQQHVVDALKSSFVPGGLPKERQAYVDAAESLDVVADWALGPRIVSYLRNMTPGDAQGASPSAEQGQTDLESYPAARALSRLIQVLGTIDGERARIEGINSPVSDAGLVKSAQEHAVLGLLEAATLVEITRNWGITPDMIGADVSGMLNPLDTGFGALLEGARAFGVPDGFVPFVWRAEDTGRGATNFEQMLALATESLSGEKVLEDAYLANFHAFEDSEDELAQQAQNLALTYDEQIASLCGDEFDPNAAKSDMEWAKCGAGDHGEVGTLALQLKQADAGLEAANSRIRAQGDKIAIDREALANTQGVRVDTLNFVEENGRRLAVLTMIEGVVQAIQDSLSVGSNAQLWNVGVPAAMAAQAFAMGVLRAGFQAQRQQLEVAQTMRFQQQDMNIELINGMANIQKEVIDLNQLGVEILQDNLARQETYSRLSNAVAHAKRLVALRNQAIAAVGNDPSHDPSFRILRDAQALQLLDGRSRAQRMLYLAARALEYEVNTPIDSLGSAVLNARSNLGMAQLRGCLNEIHTSYRLAFGTPQRYTTEVSVREMLGIFGPRTDEVTGEELSAGQQFRLATQKNQSFSESGALTVTFSTNLMPDNGLWSSDVCGDRISSVQAELVGDQLGDDDAQVNIALAGGAVIRECDSEHVQTWSMGEGSNGGGAFAVVQAGVNSYGSAAPNTSLYGQSVARASWQLTIPPGSVAPANGDLDLSKLEDIVVKIDHQAAPRRETPLYVDTSCLSAIN